MTDERKQTDNTGSDGIPQQESPAGAGPSREVPQTDSAMPVTGVAGTANEELEWAKKHMTGHQTVRKPPRPVFRKTELLGIAPPA